MENKSRRIKILFTIPNFDTAGSGKALLNVAKKLNPKKFEVEIACLHNRGSFFEKVEASGFKVHVFTFIHPMKPYLKGLAKCYKNSKIFKAISPDIVHSFHYGSDYSEALAVRLSGAEWIYTKKNMNWGGSSKRAWKLRTKLASAIIAQNTDMLEQFFSDSGKVTLIPRGVDTSHFYPKITDVSLLKKWNLLPEHKIVICLANMVPVKGIDILLKAFKEVVIKHSDCRLLLVGDCNNEYGQQMKNLAGELNIDKAVIFCGKQQQVSNFLSLGRIVVLPTLNEGRKEGSPVSLLEAMSCGKTVLGSDVSGINDQLASFPELLVEAGDVNAWINKLLLYVNKTDDELKRLGNSLRIHICNNYSIEREVLLTEKLYISCYE